MDRRDGARAEETVSIPGRGQVLVALLVVAVAQVARVLFPIMYEIGEDWNFVLAGLVAMATFAAPVIALAATRIEAATAVTAGAAIVAGVLVGLRLIDPIPAWLAVVAVGAALAGATIFIARFSFTELVRSGSLVPAIVFGLAGDAALRAAFGTWDLVWQSSAASLVIAVLIAVALVGLAVRDAGMSRRKDGSGLAPSFWIGLGAYLVLQLLFLQNIAFVGSQGGFGYTAAALTVLAGSVAAIAAAQLGRRISAAATSGVAGVAILAAWGVSLIEGIFVAVIVVGLQAAVTGLLARSVAGTVDPSWRATVLRATAGSVLFLALVLLWSLDIDQPLPFPRQAVPALAAGVVAWWALRRPRAGSAVDWLLSAPAAAAVALLAIVTPIALAIAAPALEVGFVEGELRLVSYNVRGSVGIDGQLAPDRIVAEIRSSDADVVILQEVARGWPIHGTMDLAAYLQRELAMDYLYVAAADGQFGNAILSRLPMLEIDSGLLPEDGSQQRSYAIARIATPGEDVVVAVAHTHSRSAVQLEALVDAIAADSRLVVAGDFNFAPDDPELSIFTSGGLVDVIGATGDPCRTTSAEPTSDCDRPDWVFVTSDMTVNELRIGSGGASDHLAIHVTLEL